MRLTPPPRKEALLFLLLGALLALRHLSLYYGRTELAHFDLLVANLARVIDGDVWVHGPALGLTGLFPGGPLYYWIHLPVLLFEHPIVGFHLYYGLLEMAAITLLLFWGRNNKLGLPRPLFWLMALFLASFSGAKLVICENMTIASILAIALMGAAVRGLGSPRARTMSLPGVLLGITVQVHLAALYLAPTLLVGALLTRSVRAARVCWLLAGWAVVLCLSLPGMERAGGASFGGMVTDMARSFDPAEVVQRFKGLEADLLPLVGLVLVIVGWFRGRNRVLGGLAITWLVGGYLTLALALSYAGLSDDGSRFATVNPARAFLMSAVLVWLATCAVRVFPRLKSAKLSAMNLLIVAAIAGLIGLSWTTVQAKARVEKLQADRANNPCFCGLLIPGTREWEVRRLVDDLLKVGLPDLEARRLVVSGPARDKLPQILWWLHRGRGTLSGGDGNLMASPRLQKADLSQLKGAKDYGRFLLVPHGVPLRYEETGGMAEILIRPEGLSSERSLLMVTLHGPGGYTEPTEVTLLLGDERIPRLDRCRCYTASGPSGYAGWYVFQLPRRPAKGEALRLRVGPSQGRRSGLWVVSLPRR